jgi:hypothetical protein
MKDRSVSTPSHDLIMRQLLIADKSMTVGPDGDQLDEGSEDEAEASEQEEDQTSVAASQTLNDDSEEGDEEVPDTASSTGVSAEAISISSNLNKSVDLRQGTIQVTHLNLQIICKVLSSLKFKDAPEQVLKFAEKIVLNLSDIRFKVVSSAHEEKLKHLFYYRLFRYLSFSFKYAFEGDVGGLNLDLIDGLRSEVEDYVTRTISRNIKNVIGDAKSNAGSKGYIAGLS